MKKIVSAAVLLVFLFNTMGYYVVFKCSQYLVKRDMSEQLRTGMFHPDLVLLKIIHPEKNKAFRQMGAREFSWRGRMFDVVVTRKSGDTTLFYCLHDKKEERLIAGYRDYQRVADSQGSSKKQSPFRSLVQNLIIQALIQEQPSYTGRQATTFNFGRSQLSPVEGYLATPSPPPERS